MKINTKIKSKIWIWTLIISLILPSISGLGAEEPIILEEDTEYSTELESREYTEEPEIDTEKESENADELSILEIEEVEEPAGLIEIPDMYTADTQEIIIEEETLRVSDSGLAANASQSVFRTYTAAEYEGSYGAQLDAEAAGIYNALVDTYVTNKKTDELKLQLQGTYKYDLIDLGRDEAGEHLLERNEEEFQLKKSEVMYMVQSAYDAFVYDYPEVFWFSAFEYTMSSVRYPNKETGKYEYANIKYISISPQERYTGASSEIEAFDKAVDATAAQISGNLPQNAGAVEILEEIHDYLCFQVTYQENTYAHTAAGVFLKGGAVVCEGYAKAFKILCSEFGIESVLIPGNALKSNGSQEGHMWNYVKLNGSWYMVDVTWDDQVRYVSKTYFLAGNSSRGFNAVIGEERTLSAKFSGANALTRSFVFPVLEEAAYTGTWHEWYTDKTVDIEANCTEAGSKSNHCRKCRASKTGTEEEVPTNNNHKRDDGTVMKNATCTSTGQMKYICERCTEEEYDEIPMTAHTWDKGTIKKNPTCTSVGKTLYVCEVCKTSKTEDIAMLQHKFGAGTVTAEPTCSSVGQRKYVCEVCTTEEFDEIPMTDHIWEKEYTVDQAPNCTDKGFKSVHCAECDEKDENTVTEIKAKGHVWDTGTVSIKPTCTKIGQRTYKCTVCTAEEYDEIPMTEHIWENEYTVDQEPGCTNKGLKSVHCAECDVKDQDTVTVIDTKGHVWDAGTVSIKPACTTIGQRTYKCTVCKTEEYDEIPMTAHIWKREYTADQTPTCTRYGQESIHCSVCDIMKSGSERKTERLEAVFSAGSITMQTGQKTSKLTVTGLVDGDYIKSWKSGNKKIVKVNKKGRITARNQTGKTEVIITLANDKYGTSRTFRIPVTVRKKEIKTQKITGLEQAITVRKGETYTLQPILTPITSQQKLTYSSSSPEVASVSAKGVIAAKSAGKTKITVRSGKKRFTITVTVPQTTTEKIKARKKITLRAGKSTMLKVTLLPSNSDQKLRFTSKNKRIATVNQKGKITGKKKGKVKIIVKSGAVTHVCTVKVK